MHDAPERTTRGPERADAKPRAQSSFHSLTRTAASSDASEGDRSYFRNVQDRLRMEVQEDFRDTVDELQHQLAAAEQAQEILHAELKEQKDAIRRAQSQLTKKEVEREAYQKELAEAREVIKSQKSQFENLAYHRSQNSGLSLEHAEDPLATNVDMGSVMSASLHDDIHVDGDLAEQNEELMYLVSEQREQLENLRDQLDQYRSGQLPLAVEQPTAEKQHAPNGVDALDGSGNDAGSGSASVAALKEELASARKQVEEQKALLKQHRLSLKRRSLAASQHVAQQRAQHDPAAAETDFFSKYWNAMASGLCCREPGGKSAPQRRVHASQVRFEGAAPNQ